MGTFVFNISECNEIQCLLLTSVLLKVCVAEILAKYKKLLRTLGFAFNRQNYPCGYIEELLSNRFPLRLFLSSNIANVLIRIRSLYSEDRENICSGVKGNAKWKSLRRPDLHRPRSQLVTRYSSSPLLRRSVVRAVA